MPRHRPRQSREKKEMNLPDYTNSTITHIIDEHIHSERDRDILKRRLVDGITFERLAEEFDRTPRQMQRIIDKLERQVIKYL